MEDANLVEKSWSSGINLQKCFTVRELANALNVCEKTILREIKRGHLGCVRVGRNIRVPYSAVKSWTARKVESVEKIVDAVGDLKSKGENLDASALKARELLGENPKNLA